MSENTPENNNENLVQEEQRGQTQGEEQSQNDQKPEEPEIQGERFEPDDENVPEEVKEKARKLGKGEPDAYYKVSEEEYEKMKKHVPEDLQKVIADSKVKNGAAPQLWLPIINNLAFGLIAFVPGLNIAYGAVLLANLKILPMWPKKKVENRIKSLPSSFKTDNNDKKQPSKPKGEDNGKQNFGSDGPKGEDNEKQPFGSKDENNQKQPFGTAGTNPSPGPETAKSNTVKFGTADNNSVLDSLKKINQSPGTGRSSSSPVMCAEELKRLKKQFKKPNIPTP